MSEYAKAQAEENRRRNRQIDSRLLDRNPLDWVGMTHAERLRLEREIAALAVGAIAEF